MRPSQQKARFRTAELALIRRDARPTSKRRLWEMMRRLSNPDGHIRVELPSGGWARVAKDASPELLDALDQMMQAARQMFTNDVQDQSTEKGGDPHDFISQHTCGYQSGTAAGS